jgi:hypothetical protein
VFSVETRFLGRPEIYRGKSYVPRQVGNPPLKEQVFVDEVCQCLPAVRMRNSVPKVVVVGVYARNSDAYDVRSCLQCGSGEAVSNCQWLAKHCPAARLEDGKAASQEAGIIIKVVQHGISQNDVKTRRRQIAFRR